MKLADLYDEPRWVAYGPNKAPINPRTGGNASSTNPATWGTYAQAQAIVEKRGLSGVGFVFNGDGLVGIDLDDAIDAITNEAGTTYEYKPFARALMRHASTYAEISPSGLGVHLIGYATIDRSIKKKLHGMGVEVYDRARYFTVTGDVIERTPEEFGSVQLLVDAILDEIAAADRPAAPEELPAPTGTPDAWVKAIVERRLKAAADMLRDAPDGMRHVTRVKAGRLAGGYLAGAERHGVHVLDDNTVIRYLLEARPPASGTERRAAGAIADGLKFGRSAPVDIPAPPRPVERRKETATSETTTPAPIAPETPQISPLSYHCTDVGNGKRMVDATRDRLRYVPEWKTWLVWSGQRWERTDVHAVKRLAHEVIRGMYTAAATPGGIIDQELAKWALKSEASARVDAMIEEAAPYLVAAPQAFDGHWYYLNCKNCIVDLRTMEPIEHHPSYMLTRLVNIDYVKTDVSTRWSEFLATVFRGDDDLMWYVQRAVGYTLTGSTDEHCLFFCYGDGANGKSTFMRALEIILDEYATTANVEALLDRKPDGDGASPTMAALNGMRLAIASEMPEGRRFDESRLKVITGGDSITARMLYGKPFTFRPSHTLWITGNHKPRISGTDAGIWRRLRILPFTASIPADKRRDSRSFEAQFREDASSILQWAVLGANLWYQNGLGSCAAVEQATQEYRGEEDIVARFVQAYCVVQPGASVSKARLYAAWREWAEDEGERAASYKSQRWLVTQLLARRMAGGQDRNTLKGIGLREEERVEEAERPSRGAIRRGEARG